MSVDMEAFERCSRRKKPFVCMCVGSAQSSQDQLGFELACDFERCSCFSSAHGSPRDPGVEGNICLHAVCEKMGMCLQRVVKSWLRHVIHTEEASLKYRRALNFLL